MRYFFQISFPKIILNRPRKDGPTSPIPGNLTRLRESQRLCPATTIINYERIRVCCV